jgi:hypothetical protein
MAGFTGRFGAQQVVVMRYNNAKTQANETVQQAQAVWPTRDSYHQRSGGYNLAVVM